MQVLDLGAFARGGVECGRAIEGKPGRQPGEAAVAFDEGAAGVRRRDGRPPAEPKCGAAVAVVAILDAAADGGVGLDSGAELVAEYFVQDAGDDGTGAVEGVEDAREVDGDGPQGRTCGGFPALAGVACILVGVPAVAGVEREHALGEGEGGVQWRDRTGRDSAAAKEVVREAEAVEGPAEGGSDGGDVPRWSASVERGHHDLAFKARELAREAGGAEGCRVTPVAGKDLVEIAVVEAGDQIEWLGDVELVEDRGRRVASGCWLEDQGVIASAFEEERTRTRDESFVNGRGGSFQEGDRLGRLNDGELTGKGFEGKGVGRRIRDADDARGRRVDLFEGCVAGVALGERCGARAGELQGTEEVLNNVGGGDGTSGKPGAFVPAGGGSDVEEEGAGIWLLPAGGQARPEGGGLEVGPFDKAGVGSAEDFDDGGLASAPGIEGIEIEALRSREADGAAAGEWGWCGRWGGRRRRSRSDRGRDSRCNGRGGAGAARKHGSPCAKRTGSGHSTSDERAAAEATGLTHRVPARWE